MSVMLDSHIYSQIFEDAALVSKIKNKLPELFLLAELDNSRNGKLGMEIGSARERILIALLMYKFGKENVNAELPITQTEVDVIVHGSPLSIKTISGRKIGGIKLIWTVDPHKALQFLQTYKPECNLLLAHINWGGTGHLYLISRLTQQKVLDEMGRENYMKLPKAGTNPRGVELSANAVESLITAPETFSIEINFPREELTYNAYDRWLEHWQSE